MFQTFFESFYLAAKAGIFLLLKPKIIFAVKTGIQCYHLQSCDELKLSIKSDELIFSSTITLIAEANNWKSFVV